MYYILDGLKSPLLAGWFALACLPATLTGGDMVQSSSIAAALQATFGWDRLAVGAAVAVLTGLVMVGGIGRIARVSSGLVPAMALLYLGGGAAVLAARADQIPEAMALIFCSALSLSDSSTLFRCSSSGKRAISSSSSCPESSYPSC